MFRVRFHEHWRFVLQRLAFLSAFVVYLESETLVTRDEVAQILDSRYQFVSCSLSVLRFSSFRPLKKSRTLDSLNPCRGKSPAVQNMISCPCGGAVEVVQDKGFHLDLEDYLAGVLIMASELVSLLFGVLFFFG